ncbi:16S rRNA (cytosine(1402)-N(4))-methyltransferase RsmH [Arhodomonas sp. AD133]|uniref:16S rRNA (cytosine(1402)-N(4))-methyltransferase RsmH n=1 Tax=Arhodomonas sp. AD133 TaxID=3415009 RepID=UPI003EC0D6B0
MTAAQHNSGDHRPVLLDAAVEALAVRADGRYVDATYGRGGHSAAIVERLGADGGLWAIDRDPEAIATARARLGEDPRCRIRHASFGHLEALARAEGLVGRVDGLLMDLGVSSPQLDDPERGFSFMRDGPLDMRMDTTSGPTAREWLERTTPETIARVLRDYGEERFARRIAGAIAEARAAGRLPRRTGEFAELVANAVPRRERHKHPATRTFQALRIAVNGELEALEAALAAVRALLAPHGRLVVISFHSLEDRLVKRFIRDASRVGTLPPGVPEPPPERRPWLRQIGKAVRAEDTEVSDNRRSRSAVMRCAERLE